MLFWKKSLMIGAAILLCAIAGCKKSRSESVRYGTLAKSPNRDSQAAAKHQARGLELLKGGKLAEAEEAFKAALEADVMFGPAHNNLGTVYFQQGKFYLAAWEFQYALKLMPNKPEPRNNLGLVFESVDKLDDAVEQYGKAIALEPDSAEYIGNSVRAKIRRGDRSGAVREQLQQLIMRDTRPEWLQWARQRLVTMESNSTQPVQVLPSQP